MNPLFQTLRSQCVRRRGGLSSSCTRGYISPISSFPSANFKHLTRGCEVGSGRRLHTSSPLDYDEILARINTPHPHNNVSSVISDKVGRNLHLQHHHPLRTIKVMVEEYCQQYAAANYSSRNSFSIFDQESPIVSTKNCFDDLLVSPDHVSRSLSDTYYIDDTTVRENMCETGLALVFSHACAVLQLMRAHTSAHQCQFLRRGEHAFLCSGDVYRRDEVDSSHYPVFHQVSEGGFFS